VQGQKYENSYLIYSLNVFNKIYKSDIYRKHRSKWSKYSCLQYV